MSELLPQPEVPALTEAQEAKLQELCDRYGVAYAREHYFLNALDSYLAPGYAEGWLGGPQHANPEYATPMEPAGSPTIYVAVGPEGDAHS